MVETALLPLTTDDQGFVRSCVDVLLHLFCLFGFDKKSYRLKGTYAHWIRGATAMQDAVGYVKWKLSSFYSFHHNNSHGLVIPPMLLAIDEFPQVLLGGRAYRYQRLLAIGKTNFCWDSFKQSVLLAKKGMPRPGKVYLDAAVQKAFDKLTAPVPHTSSPSFLVDWSEPQMNSRVETVFTRETFRLQAVRTVREVLSGLSYTDEDRVRPYFPSTSANYIMSRGGGGTLGHLLALRDSQPGLFKGLLVDDAADLLQLQLGNLCSTKKPKPPSTTSDFRRSGLTGNMVNSYDDSPLRYRYALLYKRVAEVVKSEAAIAEPVGLAEALKVRVITKGPPLHHFMLKPLQKFLWRALKNHPAFALTGKPIEAWHIQSRLGTKLAEGQRFLSVDYSDATNELYSFASDIFVHAICDELKLPAYERDAFVRVMTKHTLLRPGSQGNLQGSMPQTRGQLMGSIVSFPVLCLVNACILRWAHEVSTDRLWTLRDAPVTINGDDAVLRTNGLGYCVWRKLYSKIGLTASPGKVYFSSSFLNMNSANFMYDSVGFVSEAFTRNHKDELIPVTMFSSGPDRIYRTKYFLQSSYVHLGLLYSLKRSSVGSVAEPTSSLADLSAIANELVKLTPESMRESILATWIHQNKSVLTANSIKIPWFIPSRLGGLGLPIVGKFKPRLLDLRLCRRIIEDSSYRLPPKPEKFGWQMWKQVSKLLPRSIPFLPWEIEGGATLSIDDLRSTCCVALLFDRRVKFERPKRVRFVAGKRLVTYEDVKDGDESIVLYQQDLRKESVDLRYYRLLQRLWHRALEAGSPPEPVSLLRLVAVPPSSSWKKIMDRRQVKFGYSNPSDIMVTLSTRHPLLAQVLAWERH